VAADVAGIVNAVQALFFEDEFDHALFSKKIHFLCTFIDV